MLAASAAQGISQETIREVAIVQKIFKVSMKSRCKWLGGVLQVEFSRRMGKKER